MNVPAVSVTPLNIAPPPRPSAETQNTAAPVEQRPASAPQPLMENQKANTDNAAEQKNPASEAMLLAEAAQKISAHLNLKNALEFSVDQNSGRNVVKIIDKSTKEVLRQIPSEEAIHIAQALDELNEIRQGLLLSAKE